MSLSAAVSNPEVTRTVGSIGVLNCLRKLWMPGIDSASPFSYIRRTASMESLSPRMVLATSTVLYSPEPSSSQRRTTDRYFPGHVTVSMRENLLMYTVRTERVTRY